MSTTLEARREMRRARQEQINAALVLADPREAERRIRADIEDTCNDAERHALRPAVLVRVHRTVTTKGGEAFRSNDVAIAHVVEGVLAAEWRVYSVRLGWQIGGLTATEVEPIRAEVIA